MTHLPVGGGKRVWGKPVLSCMHCINKLKCVQGGGFFVVMLSSSVGSGVALWCVCGDALVPALHRGLICRVLPQVIVCGV